MGHPILFPNILQVGSPQKLTMQFRVPVDDENTLHISIYIFRAADGAVVPRQDPVPYYYNPLIGEDGRFITNVTFNQDYMAWVTQGPVARRDLEKLGESDKGIIMFRKMLNEQMEIVQDGGDPMNVFRSDLDNALKAARGTEQGFRQRRPHKVCPAGGRPKRCSRRHRARARHIRVGLPSAPDLSGREGMSSEDA